MIQSIHGASSVTIGTESDLHTTQNQHDVTVVIEDCRPKTSFELNNYQLEYPEVQSLRDNKPFYAGLNKYKRRLK
jgi:hypothetical protein